MGGDFVKKIKIKYKFSDGTCFQFVKDEKMQLAGFSTVKNFRKFLELLKQFEEKK